MSGCVEEFPSIVVTEILSYLTWNEKLNATQAVPSWKPHLRTPAAWPLVCYCSEGEENVYFVKEKRANLLICFKIYGKYMRHIDLAFGYKTGRSGLQILNAIANYCPNVQSFHFVPQENPGAESPAETRLTRSDVVAVCSILSNCKQLSNVGIISPIILWSNSPGTNLILELCSANVANKVTELELISGSLLDHDGYLKLLREFTGLKKLMVRREKINNEILLTLVKNGLQEITLYQDEELALVDAQQLGEKLWNDILKINPKFRVDLILQYILVIKDSFITNMPLRSLVLDDLVNIVTKGVIDHLVTYYNETLESFTYTNLYLENFESGDSRLPAALVTMVKKCQHLHTLRYGFPLSSTSILLLAKARKLRELTIPAVEVSYEMDWEVQEDWDIDFWQWLEANCKSEPLLENAVSELLGFRWQLFYENFNYLTFERNLGLNL
ncbi:uncharacterized protein LOC123565054 [Mercenaria mercenaria]|uniref:uncharacterized protein LOC123565054 n=1 Tax=Mercenaria mercenaria TaxID=6596 RepID=UPI00234F1EF7|nr:uncharacterized protein LOC123565054 [Mercenaria mercenaria]